MTSISLPSPGEGTNHIAYIRTRRPEAREDNSKDVRLRRGGGEPCSRSMDGLRGGNSIGADSDPEWMVQSNAVEKGRDEHAPIALSSRDKRNIVLLIVLYLLQGIPLGLTLGSLPYLLRPHLTYASLAVFTLSSYPYSLKLLWSPVVDGLYSVRIGRRKSWIVPIQITAGLLLLIISGHVADWIEHAESQLYTMSTMFFTMVLLCATQDVAVDGWALTLLSEDNLSYASTAQTVGLNTGYFLSFTVFLAFSSPDFANKYFWSIPRDVGIITLAGYLRFWGVAFIFVTIYVAIWQHESDARHIVRQHDAHSVHHVYRTIARILRLPQIQSFVCVLLLSKLGFVTNDSVTNLALQERGLSNEDLALVVLIDFPFEIIFGYFAARWSVGTQPLRPWRWAFVGRLIAAIIGMATVRYFPADGVVTRSHYMWIILAHIMSSFMSTVMFVSSSAFHNRIADPLIGGTYMTLLNTISNLGGTWPKFFVLNNIERFTTSSCVKGGALAYLCDTEELKEQCLSQGGRLRSDQHGYFLINTVCVLTSALVFFVYIRPRVIELERLPLASWRLKAK